MNWKKSKANQRIILLLFCIMTINLTSCSSEDDQSKPTSGNAVYVVGNMRNGSTIPKLWQDGLVKNLADEALEDYVWSVYVTDNDVYVAGDERSGKYSVAK